MTNWHDFNPTSEDDQTCAYCGVICADEVVDRITVGCPVPVCSHPSNGDGVCVFVLGEDGPVCSYCEVAGTLVLGGHDEDDGDLDDDVLVELELNAALADLEGELGHIWAAEVS